MLLLGSDDEEYKWKLEKGSGQVICLPAHVAPDDASLHS